MSKNIFKFSKRFLSKMHQINDFSLKRRADLDFDFLLNEKNLEIIRSNVKYRKGVGNIDRLHQLWKQIENYSNRKILNENEYRNLWDEVRKFFFSNIKSIF